MNLDTIGFSLDSYSDADGCSSANGSANISPKNLESYSTHSQVLDLNSDFRQIIDLLILDDNGFIYFPYL